MCGERCGWLRLKVSTIQFLFLLALHAVDYIISLSLHRLLRFFSSIAVRAAQLCPERLKFQAFAKIRTKPGTQRRKIEHPRARF